MRVLLVVLLAPALSCSEVIPDVRTPPGPTAGVIGCDGQVYTSALDSDYVLPYPVGQAYRMNLGNCSTSFHSASSPDRYAYDFATPVGSEITASRAGTVVHVEESGQDGGFPNNLVVVDHGDGSFAQYMHLTVEGADVEVGDSVEKGDAVGRSGNTGLAGYPHLHFIVTTGGWPYPYRPTPVSFQNARPLLTVLREGGTYEAAPY